MVRVGVGGGGRCDSLGKISEVGPWILCWTGNEFPVVPNWCQMSSKELVHCCVTT